MNHNPSSEQVESPVVERVIEVYPADYVTLKEQSVADSKKISELQHRCQSLEHLLAFCDVSPMNQIVHDYKSMSDFYITQLTKEIEIYRFSKDERAKLLDFIAYLRSIAHDIEDMLLVDH